MTRPRHHGTFTSLPRGSTTLVAVLVNEPFSNDTVDDENDNDAPNDETKEGKCVIVKVIQKVAAFGCTVVVVIDIDGTVL